MKVEELLEEREALLMMGEEEACLAYNVDQKNEAIALLDDEIEYSREREYETIPDRYDPVMDIFGSYEAMFAY